MKQPFEITALKIIRFIENFEGNDGELGFLYWLLRNHTPLIYWLFHVKFIRNNIKRIL